MLMRLLEKEREDVDEKQHDLELLLPELQVLMKTAKGRPTVRYFDGVEGLRAIRREMLMYSEPGDTWYSFSPYDHLNALFRKEEESYYRQRVAKRIKTRTLYSARSSTLKEKLLQPPGDKLTERRYVSDKLFPSPSGMTIFRERIAVGSFIGKLGGVIIESPTMADMMR